MSTASPSVSAIAPSSASDTRLHGRWLLVARCTWLALAALTLVVFIASMPVCFTELQTICRSASCPPWQITPETARIMQQVGLMWFDWIIGVE